MINIVSNDEIKLFSLKELENLTFIESYINSLKDKQNGKSGGATYTRNPEDNFNVKEIFKKNLTK